MGKQRPFWDVWGFKTTEGLRLTEAYGTVYVAVSCGGNSRLLSVANRYGCFLFQTGDLVCPYLGRFSCFSPTLCNHGDGRKMRCLCDAIILPVQLYLLSGYILDLLVLCTSCTNTSRCRARAGLPFFLIISLFAQPYQYVKMKRNGRKKFIPKLTKTSRLVV